MAYELEDPARLSAFLSAVPELGELTPSSKLTPIVNVPPPRKVLSPPTPTVTEGEKAAPVETKIKVQTRRKVPPATKPFGEGLKVDVFNTIFSQKYRGFFLSDELQNFTGDRETRLIGLPSSPDYIQFFRDSGFVNAKPAIQRNLISQSLNVSVDVPEITIPYTSLLYEFTRKVSSDATYGISARKRSGENVTYITLTGPVNTRFEIFLTSERMVATPYKEPTKVKVKAKARVKTKAVATVTWIEQDVVMVNKVTDIIPTDNVTNATFSDNTLMLPIGKRTRIIPSSETFIARKFVHIETVIKGETVARDVYLEKLCDNPRSGICYSNKELKDIAKTLRLTKYSTLSKSALVDKIIKELVNPDDL